MKKLKHPLAAIVCGLLLLASAQSEAPRTEERPNFIFILLDDFGWTFPSFPMDRNFPNARSDYFETPNLTRLAEIGMRFSNAYASAAICSPTRRSIQLGQTPARQGEVYFESKYDPVKQDLLSIPRLLKSVDSNYRAAHYGKWDLRTGIFPEDLGYDESDGNTGNSEGNVFSHKDEKWTGAFLLDNPKKIESLTDRAVNFLERQTRAGRPFYLQLSHYATHVDMQTKPATYAKYQDKEKGQIHNLPQFAGMVEDVDNAIGRLLDKVKELGIEDRTYIILMADNGGVPFIAPNQEKLLHPSKYSKPNRNAPLRGGKWTLYEGGLRSPFLVAGPDVKKNAQCDEPVAGWDLLPTLADLAGYNRDLPDNVDGGSFAALLRDEQAGPVQRPFDGLVFHRFSNGYPHSAIRLGDYKLVKYWKNNALELYNLQEDLGETENLADRLPDKTKELHDQLTAYLREVNAEALQYEKGELLYKNDLSSREQVRDWIMEGPGKIEIRDGWMQMYAPGEEGHHVFWCPQDFPANFIAEWELQNLEPDAGLCIVFFSARGVNGEDIFDPSLQPRDGVFHKYTKSDLDSYHISYYANGKDQPGREVSHLRKNKGFHRVQVGAPGIPVHSTDPHRIKLARYGDRILMYVDDRKIIDWTDDGQEYGPVLGGGKIGFRQMQWTHFRYRNFKVWKIEE